MKFLAIVSVLALSACNGVQGGEAGGADGVEGRGIDNGSPDSSDEGGADGAPALGDTCHSDDPGQACLALKYVVYKDAEDNPVSDDETALANLNVMNSVWSRCGIRFQIDEVEYVDPREKGLLFSPTTQAQLTSVRQAYESKSSLLIVTTGPWAGTLGAGSANAWATMPGGSPNGVVLENSVHDYSNIYAHEIGHSLNLDHASSTSNVMSAVIYTSSIGLSDAQCAEAQQAIDTWLVKKLR